MNGGWTTNDDRAERAGFITGSFGQNFPYLSNHIMGPVTFWGLGIGAEVVAVSIVLVLFRRRKWL